MPANRPRIAPVVFAGLVALALTACGPAHPDSQSATSTQVHGELIDSTKATVATATASPEISTPAPAAAAAQYAPVGFDRLANFNFITDDIPYTNQNTAADLANQQIPPAVKALDQQKISIKGFMLPLKVEDGAVTEFLILKDQSMCCYGNTPRMNEWVSVKTTGAGVKSIMDQPVSVTGTLHVGARRDNGYLVGIYQLDGEKLNATP